MAIKMIPVKCPQCDADLEAEEGRRTFFCQYCGAKVIIQNDNEHIYHTIDDAALERAETDHMVKKYQIEMARKRSANKEKKLKMKIKFTVILAVLGVLMLMIGFIGGSKAPENSDSGFYILAWLGLMALIGIFSIWVPHEEKDTDIDLDISGIAKVPDSIVGFDTKNYAAIESVLESAGFRNIKCVPLKDLTMGLFIKPGMVESIVINGKKITSGGDRFSKEANIVISYHSFPDK